MSETEKRKEMHYGSIETSEQLKATLAVLQQGGIRTTATIRRATRSQAVHSDIAALRKNDILIRTHALGKKRGRRVYGYELVGVKGLNTPKMCDGKTEVWSRVCGFFRPVQQWNKGKKEEFRERKPYAISADDADGADE